MQVARVLIAEAIIALATLFASSLVESERAERFVFGIGIVLAVLALLGLWLFERHRPKPEFERVERIVKRDGRTEVHWEEHTYGTSVIVEGKARSSVRVRSKAQGVVLRTYPVECSFNEGMWWLILDKDDDDVAFFRVTVTDPLGGGGRKEFAQAGQRIVVRYPDDYKIGLSSDEAQQPSGKYWVKWEVFRSTEDKADLRSEGTASCEFDWTPDPAELPRRERRESTHTRDDITITEWEETNRGRDTTLHVTPGNIEIPYGSTRGTHTVEDEAGSHSEWIETRGGRDASATPKTVEAKAAVPDPTILVGPAFPRSTEPGVPHDMIGDGDDGFGPLHLDVTTWVTVRRDPKRARQTMHLLRVTNDGEAGRFRAVGWWLDEWGYSDSDRWDYSWRGTGATASEREQRVLALGPGQFGELYICRADAENRLVWPISPGRDNSQPQHERDPEATSSTFFVQILKVGSQAHHHEVLSVRLGASEYEVVSEQDRLETVLDGGEGS